MDCRQIYRLRKRTDHRKSRPELGQDADGISGKQAPDKTASEKRDLKGLPEAGGSNDVFCGGFTLPAGQLCMGEYLFSL